MVAATVTPSMSFSPYYHLSQLSQQQLPYGLLDYQPVMLYDKHQLPTLSFALPLAASAPNTSMQPLAPALQHQLAHQHQLLLMSMDYYYYSQPHMLPQPAKGYLPYPLYMGYNYLTEYPQAGDKRQIDYSQLVSYTNSLASRRRRRSAVPPPLLEVMFPCTQCGKVFQKLYNLKLHMRTHLREKPYACQVCSKTFARSHDMRRHQLLHEGKKNFKCEGFLKDGVTKWGCGRLFARSDALARHFRTETGWMCIKPFMDEARALGLYTDSSRAILDAAALLLPLLGLAPASSASSVLDTDEAAYTPSTIYPQAHMLTPDQPYDKR